MFTLLKREIQDHLVYFLAAAIFAAALAVVVVVIAYNFNGDDVPQMAIALMMATSVIVPLGFVAMGVSQMRIDRTNKASFFLTTLPVTRCNILAVRIITGILAILVLIVPILITAVFVLKLFARDYPLYTGFVFEIFTTIFLVGFACYCVGLQIGWTDNRFIPVIGGIVFTIILGSLIAIKGFGPEIWLILLFFIASSLTRTWQKFTTDIL
jgi:hypothetical protein